jgi:hypothetical protein
MLGKQLKTSDFNINNKDVYLNKRITNGKPPSFITIFFLLLYFFITILFFYYYIIDVRKTIKDFRF